MAKNNLGDKVKITKHCSNHLFICIGCYRSLNNSSIKSDIDMDTSVNVTIKTMEFQQLVFGWIDYALFGGLLGLSLSIGLYFGFYSKQNSISEYLFGGKTINYVPVAASILASFLSGITFLGVPTEVYLHGSQYYITAVAALFIGIISAHLTLPVFYKLQVSSCYEYLELRFSKNLRTIASVLYIITLFIYIPIVVYAPALAFSQVSGYSVYLITPVFCFVCITYTSMGGVKAVVWTDAIQFVFTIAGLISVLILGVISIGGLHEIWKISEEGQRIKFFDMNPSLYRRDTFWSILIGMTFSILARLGLGQKFVQRYLAVKKESDLKKAVYISTIGWAVVHLACVFTGLVMYAQYHGCDPLKAKLVDRSDQILPYYVMDIAGHLPGLPGIFLAGLVSSALSTMSASLNTLSGIICDIFISKWIPENDKKEMRSANVMKALSVIIGVICIGLVFVVERMGTVFEMAISLSSATESALLGLFLSGLFVPWIGKKGATTGACVSLLIMSWIVGMSQWHMWNKRITFPSLPTSIDSCPLSLNNTTVVEMTTQVPIVQEDEPMIIFRISMIFFTLMGSIIVIVVGSVTSYFCGETDMSKVNHNYFSPIIQSLLPREKMYLTVPMKDTRNEKALVKEETAKYCNK